MNPLKASISLRYNGVDVDGTTRRNINSFKYTDVASGSSDSISIVFSDPERKWINAWFPVKGDRLEPTIHADNWIADGKRSSLACGLFYIDSFSFNGNPLRTTLEAVAVPVMDGFKGTKRTATYERTNLREIGAAIASRNGIALHYSAPTISVEKTEQSDQDDCNFYNTILKKYGLVLKIFSNRLVVFDEADYERKTVVAELTERDIDPGWTWNTVLAGTYTGIKYSYFNSEKDQEITFQIGSSARLLDCNEPAENRAEAMIIARAALNNANKSTTTMRVTMKADPRIIATSCVKMTGFGKLSGKYYVESVEHSVGSGYKTALSLRRVESRF